MFLSRRRAFGRISRVKEPHSSSPYNCADSEPGQTSLIFLATTKRSGRRVERSQPGWAKREKKKAEKENFLFPAFGYSFHGRNLS